MADLYTALSDFDDSQAKQVKTYSGLLGLPTSNKTVDVPDRNGYVYVRLRDNQSEIIQAFNEKVSAVYNLPVLVARQGNRWVIVSRDIERYENWGSYSAFIPAHAHQHEFNRDDPGGDVVFSYVDQFMPLNVYPSGTPGSPNVLVGAYSFKKNDSTWAYVGNTGTASVLIHKPTNNQARIILVYLDRATGNPGILVNSGTSFAANLTGTHDILQYLPSLTSTQEPLKAIRLVSGTTYVGWDNLYDVRQFFGGTVSGTGGSATPGGSDTQVQYNDAGAFNGDSGLVWYEVENCLIVGDGNAPPAVGTNSLHIISDTTSPGFYMWSAANNFSVAPFIAGLRGRGTILSPSAVQADDYLFRLRGRGYNGTNWTATHAEILFDVPYTWASGSHPTRLGMWITPSGTAIMEEVLRITEDGPDIRNATTYNINGSPHTHNYDTSFGGIGLAGTNNSGTPNTQYDFSADLMVLRNPSDETIIVISNTGTLTNNILTSGPTANGRDQSAMFVSGSWVHFYGIHDGATLATLSSANPPLSGPTLPSSYTHWCYLGAVRFNSSGVLVATKIRNGDSFYNTEQVMVGGGTVGSEQTVDTSTFIPPNAGAVFGKISYLIQHGTPGTGFKLDIRLVTGANFFDVQPVAQVNGVTGRTDTAFRAPNLNQKLLYLITTVAGSTQNSLFLICNGYTMSNGF